MPAAAVIPALRVYSHIVAVKTPIIGVAWEILSVLGRVDCEQIRTLSVWNHKRLYLMVRSMRATGGRSISWRAVKCSDPWERNKGEGIYLDSFCRSKARVEVSNWIRAPGSFYLKRCRQGLVLPWGQDLRRNHSSLTLRELQPQGWNLKELREGHTSRGGVYGLVWINTGKLTRISCFLWLTACRAFRIGLLVVHVLTCLALIQTREMQGAGCQHFCFNWDALR